MEWLKIVCEFFKTAYDDMFHPVAKETGKVMALPVRYINTKLAPCYKYVMNAEANMRETELLLEKKLEKVNQSQIEEPDAHVAIPVLQALSYSTGSEELRNMYANLLAASMVKMMKDDVHPSYVELIKQLSPDEARIMRYIFQIGRELPLITLRSKKKNGGGEFDRVKNFSTLYRTVPGLQMRDPERVAIAIDNLARLGLLIIPEGRHYVDDTLYAPLENDGYIQSIKRSNSIPVDQEWYTHKGFLEMSALGQAFAKICIAGIS